MRILRFYKDYIIQQTSSFQNILSFLHTDRLTRYNTYNVFRIASLHNETLLHSEEKYRGYFNNIVLELSDEEKKYTERIKIPSQYEAAGLSNHYRKAVYDRAHIFYDIEVFPLKDDAPLYDPFTIDVRKKYDRE